MISHQYKLIFIHINKAAGLSVENAFGATTLFDHSLPKDIIEKIGIDLWSQYFKFSIVRNPWDRFVSMYHFRIQNNMENHKSFERFITDNVDNLLKRPQLEWISDENGNVLMDFVGKFENLQKDFNYVCSAVGANLTLPHLNKSEHRHYSCYYNEKTIQMVKNICQVDANAFNYTFSGIKL
jgi:hypothetical protein